MSANSDISVCKQKAEEFRTDPSYARGLIEASLDALVTICPHGNIIDVNRATEEVTGVPRDRLIGSDFSGYFTEAEKAREGYQTVFRQGLVRDYPLTIRHTSGRTTDVLYNATMYRDAAGEVQGVFAAARDVTAQRQAAQYARSLIEASLDPLVTIGPDGKITDVNEASIKVAGVPREQLIGSDFSSYFTEPDKAREGYRQVLREGFVRDYPLTIRHTSGRTTEVMYNATVYRNAAGEVEGVFAAARDITDRKRAEEALARRAAQEALARQAQELMEISLPVVQVWDGVALVPLIGTLDSRRTQQLMERLLPRIVETNSSIALLDITGVPAIDTQTAHHLIETISAVKLLGAQVVLTGVRPAIAQTLVHLGIDLSGITIRSSLTAGLRLALEALKLQVVSKNEG